MSKEKDKLIKDKECAMCKKWLECKGKPRGTLCINYEERPKNEK